MAAPARLQARVRSGPKTVGDVVRARCTLTTEAGADLDPDQLKLRVRAPGFGEVAWMFGTDPELVKADVGEYYADIELEAAGDWALRWEATGDEQGAAELHIHAESDFSA